jgi:hypothetical protein
LLQPRDARQIYIIALHYTVSGSTSQQSVTSIVALVMETVNSYSI